MGLNVRKRVFSVIEQVRLKPAYSVTGTSIWHVEC